jgi:glucose-1-phosphate cytidylyltransferase
MTPPLAGPAIKVVILCGGLGTRLREETEYRPKPLVPVGDRPILWHIMQHYASFGCTEFILALGYKGEMIKDYFLNLELRHADFALEVGSKRITRLTPAGPEASWKITFVETGADTMTGGRLKRVQPYLPQGPFMLTYGDGVSDVDLNQLFDQHARSGCTVTVTGVRPLSRFGELEVDGSRVRRFVEKPLSSQSWINGGFFVMDRGIFEYLEGDHTVLERDVLARLARERQLAIFKHEGYWQCMDTYRDMQSLNEQWNSGQAPWVRRWRQAA